MKKIALLVTMAIGSLVFAQSNEELGLVNGNLASSKYINKLKNKKLIKNGTATTFEGIPMLKYSSKTAPYDAISLESLNKQNNLAPNNPVLVNGKSITKTSTKIIMNDFSVLKVESINGNKTLIIATENK